MKKLIFFVVAISCSTALFAYPISPRPLRQLVIESEYIVWAHVLKVGSTKSKNKVDDIWERDYAVIIITEILQGKLQTDTIRVYFCSGMICPAPGVLLENEEALVFLDKREKRDGYEIHALSYGVKHGLTKGEYGIYKSRIKEMQAILDASGKKDYNDEIIEWLVRCAQEKCTRWEGVYELSPESDFMSYYDMGQLVRKDIFLTFGQRKKLFDVLLSIDTLGYADLGLADITSGINDSALLDFLKSRLIRADVRYYWEAIDIMRRIVDLTDDTLLKDILKKADELHFTYDDRDREKMEKIFADFTTRMEKTSLKSRLAVLGDNNT